MKQNTRSLLIVFGIVVAVSAVAAFKQYRGRQAAEAMGEGVVLGQGVPVLLELGSHSCVPCQQMMPILKELSEEYVGQLGVKFVDIREKPEVGEQYAVQFMPTQVFLDADGKELFRHVGFYPKADIVAKWGELGVVLEKAASDGAGAVEVR